MREIKIKLSINKNHLNEIKKMSLIELEKNFNSIYGQFAICIGDYSYLTYIDDETFTEEMLPSELIDFHFASLLNVVENADSNGVYYIKYIENGWTWLKFRVDETIIHISELSSADDNENGRYWIYDDLTLDDVEEKAHVISGPYVVKKDQFLREYNAKLIKFIDEVIANNELVTQTKTI